MHLAEKLETCAAKYNDDILPISQQNAWKGFYDFYKTNGTDKDSTG